MGYAQPGRPPVMYGSPPHPVFVLVRVREYAPLALPFSF